MPCWVIRCREKEAKKMRTFDREVCLFFSYVASTLQDHSQTSAGLPDTHLELWGGIFRLKFALWLIGKDRSTIDMSC